MIRGQEKHNKLYLDWKKKCGKRIPGITEANSRIILSYINDMEYEKKALRSTGIP